MNGYLAFYAGKVHEVHADSKYAAQLKAIEFFKPPKSKRHLVAVELAEIGGKQVHLATEAL